MLNKGKYIVEAVKILSLLLQTKEKYKKTPDIEIIFWEYENFDIDDKIMNKK
jgi:hypothetical protein